MTRCRRRDRGRLLRSRHCRPRRDDDPDRYGALSTSLCLRAATHSIIRSRRGCDFAPWILVLVAVVWGLVELRPELTAVPYLDDSSIHQQMVRFASTRISQGHLPLTSWFPYLGLGSPQFLHYQSLPSMITGLFGTFMDPDTAFRWSMYLLLALWPLAIYWSARLFGLGRWTAGAAAAGLSPAPVGGRHRLRGHGLHLARLRRVDPAVGVVDAAARVGLHLPRPATRVTRSGARCCPPSSSSC